MNFQPHEFSLEPGISGWIIPGDDVTVETGENTP
jgi:hypothetical protein